MTLKSRDNTLILEGPENVGSQRVAFFEEE